MNCRQNTIKFWKFHLIFLSQLGCYFFKSSRLTTPPQSDGEGHEEEEQVKSAQDNSNEVNNNKSGQTVSFVGRAKVVSSKPEEGIKSK